MLLLLALLLLLQMPLTYPRTFRRMDTLGLVAVIVCRDTHIAYIVVLILYECRRVCLVTDG